MKQIPLACAAAALLAAGCASQQPSPTTFHPAGTPACKGQDNSADCYILVDAYLDPATGQCSVVVVPSQFNVGFKNGAKDKWVQWMLTESAAETGFRFARNGIDPKANPPGSPANVTAWNRNFSNGGADHGGDQYKWKNANDPAQGGIDYFYLVQVELRRPGLPTVSCYQDPVIRNQR